MVENYNKTENIYNFLVVNLINLWILLKISKKVNNKN